MTNQNPIPTYIITAKNDGKIGENVFKQFSDKDEFSIKIIELIRDANVVSGLRKTIQLIIKDAIRIDADYVLVCKDNHEFMDNYSKKNLLKSISQAKMLNADMLCGGLDTFKSAFRVTKNIFWLEDFSGLPFIIIFRSFFEKILGNNERLFPFTNGKFFIYPFISLVKEADHHDTTLIEYDMKKTDSKVKLASMQVEILEEVSAFYGKFSIQNQDVSDVDFENISIPTYVINLQERADRLEHIKRQFAGKNEFDIRLVEACKNPIGALGLWESIRKIIKMAIDDEESLIIICEDDHEFTTNYSKLYLLKNIVEAHEQQTEMLSGGICAFHKAFPISLNRAWISTSFCTQFIVLYKSVFQKILNASYDINVTADGILSQIVSNKSVLYPFISIQKQFGYSDVTNANNEDKDLLPKMFNREDVRLKRIFEAKKTYSKSKVFIDPSDKYGQKAV